MKIKKFNVNRAKAIAIMRAAQVPFLDMSHFASCNSPACAIGHLVGGPDDHFRKLGWSIHAEDPSNAFLSLYKGDELAAVSEFGEQCFRLDSRESKLLFGTGTCNFWLRNNVLVRDWLILGQIYLRPIPA